MIQRVEQLGSELQIVGLPGPEVFQQREIQIHKARPHNNAGAFVTELAGRGETKAGSIEPSADSWIGECDRPCDVWTVVESAGLGLIDATDGGREWKSGLSREDPAKLPAAEDGIFHSIPIRALPLASAKRKLVDVACNKPMADIGTGGPTIGGDVVNVLNAG